MIFYDSAFDNAHFETLRLDGDRLVTTRGVPVLSQIPNAATVEIVPEGALVGIRAENGPSASLEAPIGKVRALLQNRMMGCGAFRERPGSSRGPLDRTCALAGRQLAVQQAGVPTGREAAGKAVVCERTQAPTRGPLDVVSSARGLRRPR